MKLKAVLSSLIATGMIVAPVAAQAGTAASAAMPKVTNVAFGARQSMAVKAKSKADAGIVVLGVLAAGAATFGLVKALDDDKSNGD